MIAQRLGCAGWAGKHAQGRWARETEFPGQSFGVGMISVS
jgi:hypothetical protein